MTHNIQSRGQERDDPAKSNKTGNEPFRTCRQNVWRQET